MAKNSRTRERKNSGSLVRSFFLIGFVHFLLLMGFNLAVHRTGQPPESRRRNKTEIIKETTLVKTGMTEMSLVKVEPTFNRKPKVKEFRPEFLPSELTYQKLAKKPRVVKKPKKMKVRPTRKPKISQNLVRLLQRLKKRPPKRVAAKVSKPVVLEKFLPEYPLYAREKGIEGVVKMRVEILANGNCGQVEILTSNVDQFMTEKAVEAMSRWYFTPLKVGGIAKNSFADLKMRFGLHG